MLYFLNYLFLIFKVVFLFVVVVHVISMEFALYVFVH